MVGIVCDEAARYTLFHQSLRNLRVPPGTDFHWEPAADIAVGRESTARAALEQGVDWVWFTDDDQTFEPDALLKLLAHDLPVVGAFYVQRHAPFKAIAYDEVDGQYAPINLRDCPEHGLVEVDAIGTGGLLVYTGVFRRLAPPWFRMTSDLSEDLFFCRRVRQELNMRIHVDLDVVLGHVCPAVAFPVYEDGEWLAGLSIARTVTAYFPIE